MTDTQAPRELMHPFVPLALGVILGAVGAALLYVGLGDDGDSAFVAAGAVLGLIGSLSALVGVIDDRRGLGHPSRRQHLTRPPNPRPRLT